jgi:hypothetical protein
MTEREVAATIRQALNQIKQGKKALFSLLQSLKGELTAKEYRALQRFILHEYEQV